jgi:putative addiction module killer protein
MSDPRIHYGPGCGVQYQKRDNPIIDLLCGGNKSIQTKNIESAKRVAEKWSD